MSTITLRLILSILEPQQIYRMHENEKKRLFSGRVIDIMHVKFTPLVFTTTGGMRKKCFRYHTITFRLFWFQKEGKNILSLSLYPASISSWQKQ